LLTAITAPCNRQNVQAATGEEEEIEEFDHIDKLQQLGINAGYSSD
jgi:hypothetical protein